MTKQEIIKFLKEFKSEKDEISNVSLKRKDDLYLLKFRRVDNFGEDKKYSEHQILYNTKTDEILITEDFIDSFNIPMNEKYFDDTSFYLSTTFGKELEGIDFLDDIRKYTYEESEIIYNLEERVKKLGF